MRKHEREEMPADPPEQASACQERPPVPPDAHALGEGVGEQGGGGGEARQEADLATERARSSGLQDQLLRLAADFDNYRKRVARDRDRMVDQSLERILKRLLDVLDSQERALVALSAQPDLAPHRDGMRAILDLLLAVLGEQGVTPIDALHARFDPRLHEAIGQVPAAGVAEGTVVEELQRGYLLRDRVLRASRVLVAQGAVMAPQGGDRLADHPDGGGGPDPADEGTEAGPPPGEVD